MNACINTCRGNSAELHVEGLDSPLQDGLQAGVVQQQVSHLHHLATGVGQPLPQVVLKPGGGFGK